MARPFLIALLTVAAMAWPAAAQGLPDAGLPEPEAAPLAVSVIEAESKVASACRAVLLAWDESDGPLPDFDLRADPDGCINEMIDQAWPFWYDIRIVTDGDVPLHVM